MKRLYKSNNQRMIAGVCGGIAEYFNIDSTIVRLGFIIATMVGGSGLLTYFIAALVIPDQNPAESQYNQEPSC